MNTLEGQSQLSVLVIDDEPQIRRLLTVALEANGYRAHTVGDGNCGIAAAAQQSYDAIILDLGLPDINGMAVLKNLRGWTQVPVIILTVQDGEIEKVESLDHGADDYVTKPFNMAELLARVRATVRRANRSQGEETVYRFGDVEINLASRQVLRKGEVVNLSATEYALFQFFAAHAGKVLTHRQIVRAVWSADPECPTSHLGVSIMRLRKKLEADPAKPGLIATEPGVGYRLVENPAQIEPVQIRPNIDWCNIGELVRVTLGGLKDKIYGRRIRVFLPQNLPLVRADFRMTEQALANLILNAVADTNSDTPVEIVAQIEKDVLALTVLDEGATSQKDFAEGIPDRCSRSDVTKTGEWRHRLARARDFVEAEGARLEASKHGASGTAFTIYLSTRENVSLPQDTL